MICSKTFAIQYIIPHVIIVFYEDKNSASVDYYCSIYYIEQKLLASDM